MSLYYCLYWCDVPRSGPVLLRIFLFVSLVTHSLTQTLALILVLQYLVSCLAWVLL